MSGGDSVRGKDRSGVKTQIVGLDINASGSEVLSAGTAAAGLYVDPHPSSITIAVASATLTQGTTNYAAGDEVGQSANGSFAFANAARASGGTGQVLTAVLTDVNATARINGQMDLLLFSAAPSTSGGDNNALNIDDATMNKLQGVISFPTPSTTSSNNYAAVQSVGVGYACDATTLYGVLVARVAGTAYYAANTDLQVRLFCLRD